MSHSEVKTQGVNDKPDFEESARETPGVAGAVDGAGEGPGGVAAAAYEDYERLSWAALPPAAREAYAALGYDAGMWDGGVVSAGSEKGWEDLTAAERGAAADLGYAREAWCADEPCTVAGKEEGLAAISFMASTDSVDFPGSVADLSSDEDSHSDSKSAFSDFGSSKYLSKFDDILDTSLHFEESEQVAQEKRVVFTVEGLYDKAYLTEKEEKEKTLGRDRVMLRRRIKTRPVEGSAASPSSSEASVVKEEEYETALFEEEYGEEQSCPISYVSFALFLLKSPSKRHVLSFHTPKGLSTGWFWHEYGDEKKPPREDRAFLFQSKANYELLSQNPFFKAHYDAVDYMSTPSFGEQMIVDSYDVNELAIGDVFEVQGGRSPLILEVSAPRIPCIALDTKHGTKGPNGMRSFAHHNLLGGVFARVLKEGELRDGMKLIRTANPHPKWTLRNVFQALYGAKTRRQYLMCTTSWNGSREELEELINLPQLCEYEWKVEARILRFKMDGINWKTVNPRLIDPQLHPLHPFHASLQKVISDGSKLVTTTSVQSLKKLHVFSWIQFVQMAVFVISVYIMSQVWHCPILEERR